MNRDTRHRQEAQMGASASVAGSAGGFKGSAAGLFRVKLNLWRGVVVENAPIRRRSAAFRPGRETIGLTPTICEMLDARRAERRDAAGTIRDLLLVIAGVAILSSVLP